MSKIRNTFIESLENHKIEEGFMDKIKKFFLGNKEQDAQQNQEKQVLDPHALSGEYIMTYRDAIDNFENIANSEKDGSVIKSYASNMAQHLKDRVKNKEVNLDDTIKDFGFISNMIVGLGSPKDSEEKTEDVADFNTISDQYRMLDMPQ
jgi:hypothetical protein